MLKVFQKEQREKINRLLSIMLPIICTQVAIIGMNFFDASMSGQAGDVDLAGAAIGGNLWMPLHTGINGILMAGMPLVAHLLGAGEKDKIKVMVRHGLLLGCTFAILVLLLSMTFDWELLPITIVALFATLAAAYLIFRMQECNK